MMTNSQSTFVIVGSAAQVEEMPAIQMVDTTDNFHPRKATLPIQGRYISGNDGEAGVTLVVDPAAIEQKLAIREINAHLEGRGGVGRTSVEALIKCR